MPSAVVSLLVRLAQGVIDERGGVAVGLPEGRGLAVGYATLSMHNVFVRKGWTNVNAT